MTTQNSKPVHASGWIESTEYADGILTLWLSDGAGLRYEGVPAHLVGLTHAGSAPGGRRSPGHIYNLLVKGRYPYTRMEAEHPELTSDELCDLLRRSLKEVER